MMSEQDFDDNSQFFTEIEQRITNCQKKLELLENRSNLLSDFLSQCSKADIIKSVERSCPGKFSNSKKPYSILIMGNHDETASKFKNFFDEIYTGPLFIAEKILLSHEPIDLSFCLNIHGHNHAGSQFPDKNHINLAANVCGYKPMNLKNIIELGYLSKITSIHRETIDNATKRKST